MNPDEVKTAVVTFGLLAEVESTLAELYRECAKKSNAAFWNGVAAAEEKHAANLTEMARMIAESRGEGYAVRRQFPAAAVRAFNQYLQDSLGQVRSGSVEGAGLYKLGEAIEQAVLDQRYPDIVSTDNAAFNQLMNRTIKETEQHLKAFGEKSRKASG
jgi:hypothetical protein